MRRAAVSCRKVSKSSSLAQIFLAGATASCVVTKAVVAAVFFRQITVVNCKVIEAVVAAEFLSAATVQLQGKGQRQQLAVGVVVSRTSRYLGSSG